MSDNPFGPMGPVLDRSQTNMGAVKRAAEEWGERSTPEQLAPHIGISAEIVGHNMKALAVLSGQEPDEDSAAILAQLLRRFLDDETVMSPSAVEQVRASIERCEAAIPITKLPDPTPDDEGAEPDDEADDVDPLEPYLDALNEDETSLGTIWRYVSDVGKVGKQREIAEATGLSTGAVYRAIGLIRVLGGDALNGSGVALAPTVSSFLSRNRDRLDPDALKRLEEIDAQCQAARLAPKARKEVDPSKTGVYVYSMGHYLDHPFDPSDDDRIEDRTLLKIGMSATDVWSRVRRQVATGMPEPPILLRVYSVGKSRNLEKELREAEASFHRVLKAFGHVRRESDGAGREWFLTSLPALDALADALGLDTTYEDEEVE